MTQRVSLKTQDLGPSGGGSTEARRVDLDWLRVGAFGLLILYHVALVFGPWEWHINSRARAPWVGVALVMTNPWRLGLLFLISGVATRFLAERLGPAKLMMDRSRRLLVPLLFGAIIFVPPQAYVEHLVKDGLTSSYLSFWASLFALHRIVCLAGPDCTGLPVNHLWFVGYVWAYAICASLLLSLPGLLPAVERALTRLTRGPSVLLAPFVWLLLVRVTLFPIFGVTNHLLFDPYNHASSLAIFLLGFFLAFRGSFWRDLDQWRWASLALAIPSLLYLAWHASLPVDQQRHTAPLTMAAFALNQWAMIAAIVGFGHRHLTRLDGPILRYLREGVFPFYIVHQTIIVVVAFALERTRLSGAIEFSLLTGATISMCLATYEIVRRVGFLRPLFGLRRRVSR